MQHRRFARRRFLLISLALFAASPLLVSSAAHAAPAARTRAAGEKQRYAPALLARLKRAPAPYAIYARAPFDTIEPNSTPAPAEVQVAPKLRIFACAEEIEPTTFAVYAGKELKEATVTVASEFLSESKQSRLPRTAIDIHVVAPLDRRSSPSAGSADEIVSELLLKDDRTPLIGPLPAVRTYGDPRTHIPAGTSKQFWVTVRVPKGQPPSVLTGRLLFSAAGVKPTPITLAVEVLPMRLRTPFLQYGIDFRSRLSGDEQQTVTPELFAKQLANIRDHGFRFVSFYDPLPALADALKLYGQAGMAASGPAVILSPIKDKGDVEAVEKLRTELGLRPDFDIYYGLPLGDTDAAARAAQTIHEASRRALTLAPITSQAAYDGLGTAVDLPVYSVDSEYAQRVLASGRRENPKRDWWSWNIAEQTPQMNRLYCGYLLYRTGLNSSPLYGAFPGPYQDLHGGDPFSGARMTAYPAQDGVIDTLQWEAAREGVDDIRYITNLKTYLREVKDLKIRKEVTAEAEAFLQKAVTRPLASLPPGELHSIRRGVANRALALLTILRGNAKRYPD